MIEAVKTVIWRAEVPTLQAAFTFVMEHLDDIKRPYVEIVPAWTYDASDMEHGTEMFKVTVSGEAP